MQCMLYSSPMFSPNNLCEIRSKLVARESLYQRSWRYPKSKSQNARSCTTSSIGQKGDGEFHAVKFSLAKYYQLWLFGESWSKNWTNITSFLTNKQTNTARIEEFSEKGDPPRPIQFLWNRLIIKTPSLICCLLPIFSSVQFSPQCAREIWI